MKSLLAIILFLSAFTSQASYIKSDYLYWLTQRHERMVDNSGDTFLSVKFEDHGHYVDVDSMISQYVNNSSAVSSTSQSKLSQQNRWKQISAILEPFDEPFYCYPLNNNDWDITEGECQFRIGKLFGDAIHKADSVYVLDIYGNEWGDYNLIVLFISDYETKESITIELPVFHEI